MASQEEDNKRQCKSNVNNEQERNFINVYKKYDSTLNSKTEPLSVKIKSLVEVWNCIGQCNLKESDVRFIVHIIDWAKLHTLNVVLTGEWKKYKDEFEAKLLIEIEKTQAELIKVNSGFASRCLKLIDVIKNPWSHPVLDNLLKSSDVQVGKEEIEYFRSETAYLVSVRLKKLCESQCEDLALNLVSAYMKCYNLSESENINLNATDTQIWFIFDIYVMLLHKFKKLKMLLSLLKGITLEEGLSLIRRFYKKRVKVSKVWKNSNRVAHLASQIFITSCVMKPIEESGTILKNILDIWLEYNDDEKVFEDLSRDIRRIIFAAESASHIYVFADAIHRKLGLKLKPLTIELYIRALTTHMNDLEVQKQENNELKTKAIMERLAVGLCDLADVLDDDVKFSRECVLTAFSLDPTLERLKRIEDLARRSGLEVLDTGQDWKCKLHPPALPTDDLVWKCNECNDWMCKPQMNVPINTNIALHEALSPEKLGISRQLCDDLVVILSSPRYQLFSWLVTWYDLHRLCVMYLNDQERTRNIVTELKFIDIDYSMFEGIKREPVDELAGIEKGYEQYLDQNYSDEQLSLSSDDGFLQDCRLLLGSDGGETTNYFPLLPHSKQSQKSDPNTLKSLRMFRPNLKRSRPTQVESVIPEKVLKTNEQSLLRQTIISPSYGSVPLAHSSSTPDYYDNTNYISTSHPTEGSSPVYDSPTFTSAYTDSNFINSKSSSQSQMQTVPYDLTVSKNGKDATLHRTGVQVAKGNNHHIHSNKNSTQNCKPSTDISSHKDTGNNLQEIQANNNHQPQQLQVKQDLMPSSVSQDPQSVGTEKTVQNHLLHIEALPSNYQPKQQSTSAPPQLLQMTQQSGMTHSCFHHLRQYKAKHLKQQDQQLTQPQLLKTQHQQSQLEDPSQLEQQAKVQKVLEFQQHHQRQQTSPIHQQPQGKHQASVRLQSEVHQQPQSKHRASVQPQSQIQPQLQGKQRASVRPQLQIQQQSQSNHQTSFRPQSQVQQQPQGKQQVAIQSHAQVQQQPQGKQQAIVLPQSQVQQQPEGKYHMQVQLQPQLQKPQQLQSQLHLVNPELSMQDGKKGTYPQVTKPLQPVPKLLTPANSQPVQQILNTRESLQPVLQTPPTCPQQVQQTLPKRETLPQAPLNFLMKSQDRSSNNTINCRLLMPLTSTFGHKEQILLQVLQKKTTGTQTLKSSLTSESKNQEMGTGSSNADSSHDINAIFARSLKDKLASLAARSQMCSQDNKVTCDQGTSTDFKNSRSPSPSVNRNLNAYHSSILENEPHYSLDNQLSGKTDSKFQVDCGKRSFKQLNANMVATATDIKKFSAKKVCIVKSIIPCASVNNSLPKLPIPKNNRNTFVVQSSILLNKQIPKLPDVSVSNFVISTPTIVASARFQGSELVSSSSTSLKFNKSYHISVLIIEVLIVF